MSNAIPPEIEQTLEQYYQRKLLDQFGTTSVPPEQELEFVDTLLSQADTVVPLPDGREFVMAGGGLDEVTEGADVASAPESPAMAEARKRGEMVKGLLMMGAGIIVFFVLLLSRRGGGAANEPPTPTPMPAGTPTVVQMAPGIPLPGLDDIVSSTDVRVSLVFPTTIEIAAGGQTAVYPIVPVEVEVTDWPCPQEEGTVSACWVFGTVVNYLVGLPSPARPVVDAVGPGAEIALRLSTERVLPFVVEWKRPIPRQQVEVLRQNRFGITLVLLGVGDDTRTVVWAPYNSSADIEGVSPVASGPSEQGSAATVAVGATVDLHTVRITPIAAWQGNGRSHVTLLVENTSSSPVTTGGWRVALIQDNGEEIEAEIEAKTISQTGTVSCSADGTGRRWVLSVGDMSIIIQTGG